MNSVLLRLRLKLFATAFMLSACANSYASTAEARAAAADAPTSGPEYAALPTTGTLTAAQIGSGLWWRPVLNETSITQVLDDMEKWKFRNLYLESFWGAKTIYPSDTFESRSTDGRDWLEFTCKEAAKRNIRVIAWAHVLYWHYDSGESATTPSLLQLHPDWIEITRDGNARTAKDPSVFVSPALPQVRSHILTLVDEFCSRPIDGVNLDYIRYNGAADFGYNPAVVEAFQSLTNIDPRTLTVEDTSKSSDWMKWVSFREDLVTSLVQQISARVRQHGQEKGQRLLVTSAYFPGYVASRGKNHKYQNWMEWVERHYLDVSNPMCYSTSLSGLERELREVRSVHQGTPVACVPALAVGRLLSPHPPYVDQHRVLEGVGFRHCIVFKYETLRDELLKAAALLEPTKPRSTVIPEP